MSMKKEKRNKLIFGLFIILIMVSSTLGFLYSGENTVKINGYKFVNTQQGWRVWIDEIDSYLYFNYLPEELRYDLNSFDLNFGFVEIYNENWDNSSVQRLQSALLFEGISSEVVDEIDCAVDTIVLEDGSNPSITKEQKCLYFDGSYVEVTELIIYKVFGIV